MVGRNANFSGKGFAENTFNVTAMTQADFDEWVEEVHETAEPITEEKFDELLEPGHLRTNDIYWNTLRILTSTRT